MNNAIIREVKIEFVRLPTTFAGDLRGLIEFAAGQMERRFKNVGRINPMWHAETASETLIIAATFADKNATTAALTELFREQNVVRYLFIDEAWIVQRDVTGFSPAEIERMRETGVSNHPDRQEVVMISGEDRNGMQTATCEIIRPAKGKARLGPLAIDTFTSMESRFAGMLAHLNTQRHMQ